MQCPNIRFASFINQNTYLPPEHQAIAKQKYLNELGPIKIIAVGNGRNDRHMLQDAALGIFVIGQEGVAVEAIQAAKIVMPTINCVLDALLDLRRLKATLCS